MSRLHYPVMAREVVEYLRVTDAGIYADFTFGEGGHTEAILAAGAKEVVALDRDLKAVTTYLNEGLLRSDPKLSLVHGRISDFVSETKQKFDGIIVDLGVSTRQLLDPSRGFSFNDSGPLDMRMDSSSGKTLRDLLEAMTERELTERLQRNADLFNASRFSRRILEALKRGDLESTKSLASLAGPKHSKRHPATVLFLALRMMVNEELYEVENGVVGAVRCLNPGGRLVVLTFHSTEDRMVKNIFKRLAGLSSPYDALDLHDLSNAVLLVNKKPIIASKSELRTNPRSRSAKLRCVEKKPS